MKAAPVVEVFGPVVQGEGALAGLPTHFVRFGGCDYRCAWCDSMYAVEPKLVREATRMDAEEIAGELAMLGLNVDWVTLSGGNPALYDLADVVEALHALGFKAAVETQGSIWKDWLVTVDHLVVSPKPPSSMMHQLHHLHRVAAFLREAEQQVPAAARSLKVVVFDEIDLGWAREVAWAHPGWPMFLSAGTDPIREWGSDVEVQRSHRLVLGQVADRYRWLCEQVAGDSTFAEARVLPQLHVVAHGHARGV